MIGWHWHQVDHMQIICTSLRTDNHASTSSLNFLQAECFSCRPTDSVKALKAKHSNDKCHKTHNSNEWLNSCAIYKAQSANNVQNMV